MFAALTHNSTILSRTGNNEEEKRGKLIVLDLPLKSQRVLHYYM
jgi:hypothetical protein